MRRLSNVIVLFLALALVILVLCFVTSSSNDKLDIKWSSEGEWIVFSCGDFPLSHPRSSLYIMRPDGGEIQKITPDNLIATYPVWTAKGDWIAFLSENTIFKMKPDGTDIEKILGLLPPQKIESIDWSPDGKWIAYTVSDITGGSLQQISSDGTENFSILSHGKIFNKVKWSPDGKSMAYFYVTSSTASSGVYIVNVNDKKTKEVLDYGAIMSPLDWSPDGKELILTIFENQQPHLYRLDLQSNQLVLVSVKYFASSPTWSPNSEWISFSGYRENQENWSQIYKSRVDGSEQQRLTDMTDCNATAPQWFDFRLSKS